MKHIRLFLSVALTFVVVSLSLSQRAEAQSAAQSKDYWVSFLPSKKPVAPIWLLMCTNAPNTNVKIIYSDDTTHTEAVHLEPGMPKQYQFIVNPDIGTFDVKPTQPEVVQKRSVHIVASNPISIQGFTDADNNVGLFLVLPTSSLGQHYVIAAYNDQPQVDGGSSSGTWIPNAFDSTAGAFVITAVEDGTDVTIKAHGPTRGGHKAGETWGVTLNKGETYWVQGASASEDDDLSQSVVTSTKPIAVTAGCEIMRAWDAMILTGHFDYNDYIVEQMIPTETWGTDYVSAPFTNKRGTNLDSVGDLYRVYAADGSTTINFNGRVQNPGSYWEFPQTTDPVHITSDKPVMVVQYDYYYDFHEANRPRTSNSEMVLVPRHNWRRNATFMVPSGYALTYFQVAANKDSIDKITVSINNGPDLNIRDLAPGLKYTAGQYAVRIIQLNKTGQAIIKGPCDFAVYNYGTRDNDAIKATYGYASAAAASFGSISNAKPPRMLLDSACTTFNLMMYDPYVDGRGIGEMFLLNDPKGLTYRNTPYVSSNVSLQVDGYDLGADSVTAHITVNNPLLDAFAALYVTNRAGKDTVYTFSYHAAKVGYAPDSVLAMKVLYGQDSCSSVTLTNKGNSTITIKSISTTLRDQGRPSDFTATATNALPVSLKPGESTTVNACYRPSDLDVIHRDTLTIETGCFKAPVAALAGSGAIPVIKATDQDFGIVDVGSTSCMTVTITNYSTEKNLTLTKDILNNSSVFAIDPADIARMPIVLTTYGTTGDHTQIHVCYTPTQDGDDTVYTTWGRDIPAPYQDTIKPWSLLTGHAISASVHWDRKSTETSVTCVDTSGLIAVLKNTSAGDVEVKDVTIDGPDASEFGILSVGSQTPPYNFVISKGSSMNVPLSFKPVTTGPSPWRQRQAYLRAFLRSGDTITVNLGATLLHPDLSTQGLTNWDFGDIDLNTPYQKTFTVMNQGTAPAVVQSITLSDNTHFSRLAGLNVGDTIAPNGGTALLTIQGQSSEGGVFNCDVTVTDMSSCHNTLLFSARMAPVLREVLATGADYSDVWTCESRNRDVWFVNHGTQPVTLFSAAIGADPYNGSPGLHSNDFVFEDPGPTATLIDNYTINFKSGGVSVAPGDSVRLQINFIPTAVDSARGVVTYTYDSAGVTLELLRPLTAKVKNFPVTVTTKNNGADYVQATGDHFVMPISVQEDLGKAEVYGYDFRVALPLDMFNVESVDAGDAPYSISSTPVIEHQAGNDTTQFVRIHLNGNVAMQDNQHTLARLHLSTKLSKKLETPVHLYRDSIAFFRADGSVICYMPTTHVLGDYTQVIACGEPIIQTYLGSNTLLTNIRSVPNPVNQKSDIHFLVNEDKAQVTVEVWNALGEKVRELSHGDALAKGEHSVSFDASAIPSGTYTIRIIGKGTKGTNIATQSLSVEK